MSLTKLKLKLKLGLFLSKKRNILQGIFLFPAYKQHLHFLRQNSFAGNDKIITKRVF